MKNIIYITVDSWSRKYCGVYNNNAKKENLTPNIDEFSKKCCIFDLAFAPSVKTKVSFLSLLSGCYPCKYSDWFDFVSDNRQMISSILKDNGYNTFGFTSNPCTSTLFGYDIGYDQFNDNIPFKNIKGKALEMLLAFKMIYKDPYYPANKLNNQILNINKKKPFFLWIHYMDIHGPYIKRNGLKLKNRIKAGKLWKKALSSPDKITNSEKEELIESYKEKMRFLDQQIGNIIDRYDSNDTIFIITGDHGEMFGEHGLYGHQYVFYNEMINIPLLIKLPEEFKHEKGRKKEVVGTIDIVPTLVDILGIRTKIQFDGLSLLPIIKDNSYDKQEREIISEISRAQGSVTKGKYKFIANYLNSKYELYDILNDYEENSNIFEKEKSITENLSNILIRHIVKHRPENDSEFFKRYTFIPQEFHE